MRRSSGRSAIARAVGRLGAVLLLCALSGGTAEAAAPVLEHLFPAGAPQGASELVQLSGKFESWPVQAWVSGSGLTITCETNRGQVRIEVARDALPGPRLVRVMNAEGASEPRFFVVGEGLEGRDFEPNNLHTAPQVLDPMPAVVNGRLDKIGDVDSFSVRVAAGEWIEARLVAHQLMGKVDPVLRLLDERGRHCAWNHDFHGFDPVMRWRSPSDQTLVLQVFGFKYPADASIQLTGGEGCVYRLHLVRTRSEEEARWSGEGEVEPNDVRSDASPALSLPAVRVAAIGTPGDVDRYPVMLEAGTFLEAQVEAAWEGSPLDAWLAIEDAAGKELTRADDVEGTRDPSLSWKVPESGRYGVVVGSVPRQGGDAFRYRLKLASGLSRAEGTLATSAWVLGPGSTQEIKVQWKRWCGHQQALVLAMRDLPEGVTAAEVAAPAGDGEVILKLVTATNAPAFSGAVQVVAREAATDAKAMSEQVVPALLVSRGENNGVPQGWARLVVDRCEHLWLTVTNVPATP